MKNYDTKKVNFKVFRFNKEIDKFPYYEKFSFDVAQDEVVLDILNKIKWERDGSFSYRRSCRHGICGSCAIKVNNKPVLSCKERVFDLIDIFGYELVFEPQDIKHAIKDMVVDKERFWNKYSSVQPYLMAKIDEHPKSEYIISKKEADKLDEADYCIQCGNCFYACPSVQVNGDYIGPAALLKAFRFNADIRDNAKKERLEIVNQEGAGVWDCVKCFECAEACPKELSPIDKITKLHNQIFKENMATDNVATRHAVGFKDSIAKHGFLDEGELVRYSEGNLGVLKHVPEALHMFKNGKLIMPWQMPKSQKLDEVQKLIKTSSTVKFK
ncbi:MAG: succinate dehydrogenase iron-sulfur subunit [Campylobacteraceae bacterium]|nr:succinate dehydrogenase iron-sulfur subunit [Campylobacteraceae bacterium]